MGELLGSLHPVIRWRPPILEIGGPAVNGHAASDTVVESRPLVLVPSVFCVGRPWVFWDVRDESLPRLLVYPVLRSFDDAVTL